MKRICDVVGQLKATDFSKLNLETTPFWENPIFLNNLEEPIAYISPLCIHGFLMPFRAFISILMKIQQYTIAQQILWNDTTRRKKPVNTNPEITQAVLSTFTRVGSSSFQIHFLSDCTPPRPLLRWPQTISNWRAGIVMGLGSSRIFHCFCVPRCQHSEPKPHQHAQ